MTQFTSSGKTISLEFHAHEMLFPIFLSLLFANESSKNYSVTNLINRQIPLISTHFGRGCGQLISETGSHLLRRR